MGQAATGATPASTPGFGPRETADETRQAQHGFTNDTPVDVNNNAIVARVQAETMTLIGTASQAAQERRQMVADHMAGKLMGN